MLLAVSAVLQLKYGLSWPLKNRYSLDIYTIKDGDKKFVKVQVLRGLMFPGLVKHVKYMIQSI